MLHKDELHKKHAYTVLLQNNMYLQSDSLKRSVYHEGTNQHFAASAGQPLQPV